MRSEIPQLEVITAIGDAEAEDYIAQLLFSQGWNIVYRAFDMNSLTQFLNSRAKELRTVLVFRNDLSEFDIGALDQFISSSLTLISLDEIPMSAHQVMQHIRSQLRLPLIVNSTNKSPIENVSNKVETFLVTGTAGAPGRSTLAINLALDFDYSILDLDFRSPSIDYLVERNDLSIKVIKTYQERPRQYQSEESAILDLGALPPIDEMVNDRRWQALILNSAFESATKILYVSKASGLSLLRLQKFMQDFPIMMRKIPIVYIFNMAGNSREERALERSFQKIVAGERAIVIPFDSKIANPSKASSKVIGKLSALVQ